MMSDEMDRMKDERWDDWERGCKYIMEEIYYYIKYIGDIQQMTWKRDDERQGIEQHFMENQNFHKTLNRQKSSSEYC